MPGLRGSNMNARGFRLNCRAEVGGEMSRQRGKSKKSAIANFSKGIEDVQGNSVFGRYSVVEMVAQLKELSMDPCRPQFAQDNIQPLWNQIVMLRKVMMLKDSEIPWRKRKLKQFVKDKLTAPADFALPNQQKKPKLSQKQFHASSVACLLSSVDSTHVFDYRTSSSLVTYDDALPEKQLAASCSFIVDVAVDTDESVYGSNHPSPEKSPISNGARRKHFETPRRSPRLLNFIGDRLHRKVVPVGPRFQAVIPEWNCPEDRSTHIDAYKNNSDSLKWLGSRVWPVENIKTKTSGRNIGKGRRSSCSCVSPGSTDCTERHILDETLVLLSDLGSAFFIWKFDQMGEQLAKSWSLKEQQTFESLMKKRPSSNSNSFWKRVSKSFPKKNRKDTANYYFNVYIMRRMSLHTRSSSLKQIDTDDEDEADDSKAKYLRSS